MNSCFEADETTAKIIEWIRDYFKIQTTAKGAIIGISGGKDSTVVAKLLVEALGKERVFGVLMPNGKQIDINDSFRVVDLLGIKYTEVNIEKSYKKLIQSIGERSLTNQAAINILPRIRMTILYALGSSMSYRVAGTGNLSERFIGYTTKWGDSACDFNPIGNLTTDEVIAIGDSLGLPYDLVHKTPTDGLSGISDEENIGISYELINKFIKNKTTGDKDIDKVIQTKAKYNKHKSTNIPMY